MAVRRAPGGDIECLARTGKECLFRSMRFNCEKDIDQLWDRAVPLVCGDPYKALYRITGYDTPGHWCAVNDAACDRATE